MVISGEVGKMSDADDMKSPNNVLERDQTEAETEPPIKRKRGRPKKVVVEKPTEESTDSPVVKRKRGRPKGSKNKNPKPKPVVTGPPRPRGRPRKWPVPDASAPKRGRGRPKKGESQGVGLPTMVPPSESDSMITHDPVPPDEMFSDSVDSFD